MGVDQSKDSSWPMPVVWRPNRTSILYLVELNKIETPFQRLSLIFTLKVSPKPRSRDEKQHAKTTKNTQHSVSWISPLGISFETHKSNNFCRKIASRRIIVTTLQRLSNEITRSLVKVINLVAGLVRKILCKPDIPKLIQKVSIHF